MFSRYFANRYFAPVYFPDGVEQTALVRPPYFPHGFFSRRYFADRYFPGAAFVLEPPPEPEPEDTGAGRISSFPPRPRFVPDIHVFVRPLALSPIVLHGRATIRPADVSARLLFGLPPLHISVSATATPADVRVQALRLQLSPLETEALVSFVEQAKSRRPHDDEDEDELMDWYMTQVKH